MVLLDSCINYPIYCNYKILSYFWSMNPSSIKYSTPDVLNFSEGAHRRSFPKDYRSVLERALASELSFGTPLSRIRCDHVNREHRAFSSRRGRKRSALMSRYRGTSLNDVVNRLCLFVSTVLHIYTRHVDGVKCQYGRVINTNPDPNVAR